MNSDPVAGMRASLTGWDPLSTDLKPSQHALLERFADELRQLNRRVNLVSRESVDDLWIRHIVHSLFLSRRAFSAGSVVVDWGTGGGLPMIPLAIVMPDVRFVGVDSVQKKVLAVTTIIRRLDLPNAEVWHGRAEDWTGAADYSVSRATAPLRVLWQWHLRVSTRGPERHQSETEWPKGLICLKGGELSAEIAELQTECPDVLVASSSLDSTVYGGHFADKAIVTVSRPCRPALDASERRE